MSEQLQRPFLSFEYWTVMENRSSGVLKVSVSVLRNSGDVVSAELGIMGPLAGLARWAVTTGDPLTRGWWGMATGSRITTQAGIRYVNVDIYCFNCYTYIGRETYLYPLYRWDPCQPHYHHSPPKLYCVWQWPTIHNSSTYSLHSPLYNQEYFVDIRIIDDNLGF